MLSKIQNFIDQHKNKSVKQIVKLAEREFGKKYSEDYVMKQRKYFLRLEKERQEDFVELVSDFLKKNKNKDLSFEELSESLDAPVKKLKEAVNKLKSQGKNIRNVGSKISLSSEIKKHTKPHFVDISALKKANVFRFAVVSDMHLGSRYERLEELHAFYKILEQEGVDTVYLSGNMIDGEARFNKFDLHTVGLTNQVHYFVKNYPQIKGIKTFFITGDDHEGWYTQREGINVGKYIENEAKNFGRDDLIFIGHMERDVIIKSPKGETIIRIVHPGGGTAYAISYTMQKLIESYQGGEKPHIVIAGHYHKAEYIVLRNVHVIQAGCFQDQTPFMRKKRIPAHIGGWIIEVTQGERGSVLRMKTEFIPFLDRGSYNKDGKWSYKWV